MAGSAVRALARCDGPRVMQLVSWTEIQLLILPSFRFKLTLMLTQILTGMTGVSADAALLGLESSRPLLEGRAASASLYSASRTCRSGTPIKLLPVGVCRRSRAALRRGGMLVGKAIAMEMRDALRRVVSVFRSMVAAGTPRRANDCRSGEWWEKDARPCQTTGAR